MNQATSPTPNSPIGGTFDKPSIDTDKVNNVAKARRMLLISIFVTLGCNLSLRPTFGSGVLNIMIIGIMIAVCSFAFSVWSAKKTCDALEITPTVWIVAMLIPFANVVCIYILFQKSTSFLKSQSN